MAVTPLTECVDGSAGHQLRPYQQELLNAALEENIIIYVDTGAGKTLVAALLAKHHIATNGDGQRQSRRVVCLVPTTILVAQQAAVFRKYVAHSVGEYTGDMGVDRWSANKWQEEISSKAMLVMTPAILCALLAESHITFADISLLIFDEAHHCTKKHPYADIMRRYHDLPAGTPRPKIFGMTASPVNTRAGTHDKMKKSIQELQDMMDARLKTVSDVTQYVPVPCKEHLKYRVLDFQDGQNPMLLFAMQIVLQDNRMLKTVVRYHNLQQQISQLRSLPEGAVVQKLDSRGEVSRAEALKDWLLNKFGFCLMHQGPFCATLLLQEYFEHAAPDGTLATLGELGAEEEFYAAVQRPKKKHNRVVQEEDATVARAGELQRSQEEAAALERVCERDFGLSKSALQQPMAVLKQTLLHALLLCIRMLVPHQELCTLLAAQARDLLMGVDEHTTDANANAANGGDEVGGGAAQERQKATAVKTRGLSLLLESALHAVPQRALEEFFLQGTDRVGLPQKWAACMGVPLVTDKVTRCLLKLQRHREKAEQEQGQVKWAAIVFAQRQTCCLTLHLLCQRIQSWASTLRTGALKSEGKAGATFSRHCHQAGVLHRFRSGTINVLFSTSVAEEGLDVQNCSIVVCYDVPRRPLSMVQTIGRARAQDSEVLFMQPVQPWDDSSPADSIKKMEEYSLGMKNAVQLWDATAAATGGGRSAPPSTDVHHVPGAVRPLTGSEARTTLALFTTEVANWHRELQSCNADSVRLAVLARRSDAIVDLDCQMRFATQCLLGGYQVTAHLPARVHELMTDTQRDLTSVPVVGEPAAQRALAKESAVFKTLELLLRAGALDSKFKPILPPDIVDLRERMEPTRNVPRYSNALNPNRVHSNRHALFWCESRYFEATHIVPEALTATYNAHTHAAHTSRLAAAHTQLGTEAERLGATAGRPGGAAGGGIDESGAVAPMLGLRKRARVSDADNGGEGGDGTSEGDQKRQRSGSQKRSKAGKSKAKAKGVAACQNADPQVAEGDVGEVWVNAFVVGSGADRQVMPIGFLSRRPLPQLPQFPWYPHPSPEASERVRTTCRLQCAAMLRMSARELREAQQFHHRALFTLLGIKAKLVSIPDDEDQCVADDKWKAVTDGMWYTIVPVRARTPGAAVQADKEQTAALPEGEPHAELDTKSLASSNLFNLLEHVDVQRMLDDSLPEEERESAQALVQARLQGRIITTVHGIRAKYQFHKFGTRTALSDFPLNTNRGKEKKNLEELPQYATFAEYFQRKYDIDLQHAEAPMIQAHRFTPKKGKGTNYLMPPKRNRGRAPAPQYLELITDHATNEDHAAGADGDEDRSNLNAIDTGKYDNLTEEEELARFAFLPVELCGAHYLSMPQLAALKYLPCLLYRVEGLLVATEFRDRVFPTWLPPHVQEPPFVLKVLEALTTEGCRDNIDHERYELLGDSCLKVGVCLFLMRTEAHRKCEGQMTSILHKMVSNRDLFDAAIKAEARGQGVRQCMRTAAYDLDMWGPPGLINAPPHRETKKLRNKKLSDVMEALIGVLFEAAGMRVTMKWMEHLGILPPSHRLGTQEGNDQEDHGMGEPCKFVETVRGVAERNMAAVVAAQAAGKAGDDGAQEAGVQAGLAHLGVLHNAAQRYAAEQQQNEQADKMKKAAGQEMSAQQIAAAVKTAVRNHHASFRLPSLFRHSRSPETSDTSLQEAMRGLMDQAVMLRLTRAMTQTPNPLTMPECTRTGEAWPAVLSSLKAHLVVGGAWQGVHRMYRCAGSAGRDTTLRHLFKPRQAVTDTPVSIEDALGYTFRDKHVMHTAVTHSSWNRGDGVDHYGKLEFLGDAVLGLVVTTYIFYCLDADKDQSVGPDQLQCLRSVIVQNDTLAFAAVCKGLHKHLLHSSTMLQNLINTFVTAVEEKLHEKESSEWCRNMGIVEFLIRVTDASISGWSCMDHPKTIADVFEALIGAVFFDSGEDYLAAFNVVTKLLDNLDGVTPSTFPKNPIGIVNEIIQQQKCKYDFVYRCETMAISDSSVSALSPSAGAAVADADGAAGSQMIFYGTARVKGPQERVVVLSEEKTAGSRRAVRARCSEQVLLRMYWDHGYLQRAIDESKLPLEEPTGNPPLEAGSDAAEE